MKSMAANTEPGTPDLEISRYELPCRECEKVSLKSFIQLEMSARLPCDHCAVPIPVSNYYGQSQLAAILDALGRTGYILRSRERDK
jgi:hypothetical protein